MVGGRWLGGGDGARCLHVYGTSTVVCHGFQHLCVCLPHLESSNMSGLEQIGLLLGIIYFTVPPKATTPSSGSRPHCSVYHLNPYEESGETQQARLKQVAERRWHTVTDSPQARIDNFKTNSFENMLLIKKLWDTKILINIKFLADIRTSYFPRSIKTLKWITRKNLMDEVVLPVSSGNTNTKTK